VRAAALDRGDDDVTVQDRQAGDQRRPMPADERRRRVSAVDVLDWSFFAYSGAAATWLAYVLLRDGVHRGWQALLLVAFWLFMTYLLLPRLHKILTDVYVPSYFMGRTRTSDGLLGDPVNLGFLGREDQLHASFAAAGWTRADDLGLTASWRLVRCVLTRRSYPGAPVSPLHLFDRQQDFAYQQEVAGSPSKRHHVRLWRCPDDWLLPGGFPVGWLGAASYDRRVGFSLFTLQITHKIEEDIDVERDFVVATIAASEREASVRTLERFASGYHSRNGGGDWIRTDGDLPIVDLRDVSARIEGPVATTDSRDRRPATINVGVALTLARALTYLVVAGLVAFAPENLADAGTDWYDEVVDSPVTGFVVAVLLGLTVVDVLLGLAVWHGHTWARLCLMSASAVATAVAFASTAGHRESVGVAELPTLCTSIVVLLALSSPRAREWSGRRGET
jgi:hypothetical protein